MATNASTATAAQAHKHDRATMPQRNNLPLQPERLIFVEDFAVMIGRSPAAVRYMISKGDGPRFALIGGRRMAKLSEALAWIDAQFAAAEQATE